MSFTIADDGTLDTLVYCQDCGEIIRTNPDTEGDRIEAAIEIAEQTHECPKGEK